ncbi:choline/ethanolamine kinase family protein [uncultured Aggregatibacter sp.]|jgi:choline kinase|uniref:choline/ethanolamine kinase family protein n=1 Tax=uncultured Aggregatibacter sp. TaxID=470564 RepID=UPI0025954E95|nr:choline/ethanolamine kinase family protein [uncultured Aggregatibacter sp.]
MIKNSTLNLIKKEIGTSDLDIQNLGGMTNSNYLISTILEEKYVVRIPGEMTHSMISRKNEKLNSLLMSEHRFNVDTTYFNENTGIKITKFLENSISLNHHNINNKNYLEIIAKKLYKLHNSKLNFNNEFDTSSTFNNYLKLLKDPNNFYKFNKNIEEICHFFDKVCSYLDKKYERTSPCHNDLVPENILIRKNTPFFIDWEYSGMNHPLFDISAFFLESNLSQENQKFFLQVYDEKIVLHKTQKDILYFQFSQDVLWFLWTIIKQENNEFFNNYAANRINRAYEFLKTIKREL